MAIHRHAVARPNDHDVAEFDLFDRHLDFKAVLAYARRVRAQAHQRPDGGRGLALGAALEPLAHQHEADEDGRALEIEVGHVAGMRRQQQVDAEAPRRRGAEGDQQVHVARPGAHRLERGLVEAPAEPELDRRGQSQLEPARRHDVVAQQIANHADDERRRKRRGDQDVPKVAAAAGLGLVARFGGGLVGDGRGLIARLFDGGHQGGRVYSMTEDVCSLGREIDRGLRDPGHLFQRALDPADAGGAGHAFDAEVELGLRRLIARLRYRRYDGVGVWDRIGERDPRLLVGQVHGYADHAGDGCDGLLDPAHARGARHPGDADVNLGGRLNLRRRPFQCSCDGHLWLLLFLAALAYGDSHDGKVKRLFHQNSTGSGCPAATVMPRAGLI